MCFLIVLMTHNRCRYTILKNIDVLHTGYRTFKLNFFFCFDFGCLQSCLLMKTIALKVFS